jgi:hypothetical protein
MPLLSHDEGQRIVGPHFGAIFQIVIKAWTEYVAEYSDKQRAKHSTTTRACILHDLMVANAALYFTATDGCSSINSQGLMLFLISGKHIPVAIRFKKFDRELLSRNQPTQQVRDFRSQQQIDALGAAYHLEAGYVLDQYESAIEQISIVCPNRNRSYWDIELRGETESVTKVQDLFEPETPDERVDIIRARRDDTDARQDDDEDEGKSK